LRSRTSYNSAQIHKSFSSSSIDDAHHQPPEVIELPVETCDDDEPEVNADADYTDITCIDSIGSKRKMSEPLSNGLKPSKGGNCSNGVKWTKRTQPHCARKAQLRTSNSLHNCVSSIAPYSTKSPPPLKPASLSLSGPNLSNSHSGAKFEAFIMTGDLILSLATSNSRENRLAPMSPMFNGGRPLRKTQASEINCSQLVKQCLTMESNDTASNHFLPAATPSIATVHRLATPNSTGSSAEHSTASTPDEERILNAGDFSAQLISSEQLLKAESPHFSQQVDSDSSSPSTSSRSSPFDAITIDSKAEMYDCDSTKLSCVVPNNVTDDEISEAPNTMFTLNLNEKAPTFEKPDTLHHNNELQLNTINDDLNQRTELETDPSTSNTFSTRYPSFIVAPSEPDACLSSFDSEEPTSFAVTNNGSFRSVDCASASRLAKRLFTLDGFKKSDVARHLYKKNDFSRAVAAAYVSLFDFSQLTLIEALRAFMSKFSLVGETQERERILLHFAKRYVQCNESCHQSAFKSENGVNALTCAILLLNSDLHGNAVRRRMTVTEFVANLSGMNDGQDFERDVLRSLYQEIRSNPLKSNLEDVEMGVETTQSKDANHLGFGVLDSVDNLDDIRKGVLIRKSCVEAGGRRTAIGKRSWKPFHGTLRTLLLYLGKGKDEQLILFCQHFITFSLIFVFLNRCVLDD
jgi:hypothetical protein